VLGDWKKVDGVLFFHSVKMDGQPGGEMTITKLEVNTLSDADFALPDEVKKLASEKKDLAAPIKLEELPADQQREAKQTVESLKKADTKVLKQTLSSMETGLQYMPEEKRKMMAYIVQETRAEIAKRGG